MRRIRSASDFLNFLSVVIVSAPDKFEQFDFLAEHEQMNLHRAFEEMSFGLVFLAAPESKALDDLKGLLDQSLRAYEAGQKVAGAHRLQDFEEQAFPGQ